MMFTKQSVSNSCNDVPSIQKELREYTRVVDQLKLDLARQHQRVVSCDVDKLYTLLNLNSYGGSEVDRMVSSTSYHSHKKMDLNSAQEMPEESAPPQPQEVKLKVELPQENSLENFFVRDPKEKKSKEKFRELENLVSSELSTLIDQQYDKITVLESINSYLRYKMESIEQLMELKVGQLEHKLGDIRNQFTNSGPYSPDSDAIVDFKMFLPKSDVASDRLADEILKQNGWVNVLVNLGFIAFVLIGAILCADDLY